MPQILVIHWMESQKCFRHFKSCGKFFHATALNRELLLTSKQWKKEQLSRCWPANVWLCESVNQLYNNQKGQTCSLFHCLLARGKDGSTAPWNVELVKQTRPQLCSERNDDQPQPTFILCRFYGPAVPLSTFRHTPWSFSVKALLRDDF